jgi:transcriptional regulator with XRE-family HTH domain
VSGPDDDVVEPGSTAMNVRARSEAGASGCDPAAFGVALRQFRLRLGLSQELLARRIAYSRPHVANIERGHFVPGKAFLPRIEAAFPGGAAALTQPYEVALRGHRRARRATGPSGADPAGGPPLHNGDHAEVLLDEADPALGGGNHHETVSLAGTWYALWETTAEGRMSIDSEAVTVHQRGTSLSVENQSRAPENPLGAFLWRAQCRVYDNRYVLGSYVPREPNVRSKGVVYLKLHTSGAFMLGRWLGCSYDDEVATGFSVLARDPRVARMQMSKHVPAAAEILDGQSQEPPAD